MFFGKPWDTWISEYSESHKNRINQICHTFGIPMIAFSIIFLLIGIFASWSLYLGIALFTLGWALQFIGHAFERSWPEFFKDWRFLFVGLRWWWQKIRS